MRSHLLRMTATTALILGMSMASGTAFAQTANADFEKGVQAFDQGKYADAIALWEPLAEDGNVEALRNLAQLHRLGLGVQQSDEIAFKLYEQAAERGLVAAQVNAAFLLLTGKGVERNRKSAAAWFAKAADQGNALAQYNLGLMYEKGSGVGQSDELALELYQAAADQGQKRAIARLEAMEESIADSDTLSGSAAVAKTEESEGAATNGLAAILKSEGKRIASGANDAERAKMADAFKAQGKKMTRPDKSEIADAVKAAADSANADLSISPVEKPLEFEILNASEKTPTPTYKSEAENGVKIKPITIPEVSTGAKEPEARKSDELVITPTPAKKPAGMASDDKTEEAVASVETQPREPISTVPIPTDPVARVKMAEAAYRGGDFSRAAEMLVPLSEEGMPIAQFWLGRLYNRGEGVPLDRTAAYALWRSAAASGSNSAATALANLSGRLSPEEIAVAEQLYASMIQ